MIPVFRHRPKVVEIFSKFPETISRHESSTHVVHFTRSGGTYQNQTKNMKTCIQTLGILAIAASLSFAEDEAPKGKKGHNPEQMFKKIDSDSSGSLSLEEFKESPMGKKAGDKAENRFKALDTDSNGSVTSEELMAGRKAKGGKAGKPGKGKKKDADAAPAGDE